MTSQASPNFQVAEIALDGIRPKPVVMPAPKGYARSLDLRSGLAKVVYEDEGSVFTREHFISAPDEVFVSPLTADRAVALSISTTLDRPKRFETIAAAKPREVNVCMNGELVAVKTEPSGPRRK